MNLFSRAFEGVPAEFGSPLDAPTALARLVALKRWAPGKPLLTGEIQPGRITLGFATGSDYGRAWMRFEGRLEPAGDGCVLRGRFVNSAAVRAFSVLFLGVCGFMGLGGLTGGLGMLLHGDDTSAHLAMQALFLVGWLLVVALFGTGILWNAAPSRGDMRDMARHLSTALQAEESASA